jgi:hypothetical protein
MNYYYIPIVFKTLFDQYNRLIDTSVYSPTRVLFVPLSDRKKNLDVPVLENLRGSIFDCCASYIQEDYEDLDKFIERKSKVPPEPVRKSKAQDLLDKVNYSLCDDTENSNESNLNFTEVMTKLSKERARNYNDWLYLGFALINLNHRKIISRGLLTLYMAKRIIAYKNKIPEQWLEKKENIQNKSESEEEDDDDDEPPKKEMVLTKINKK